MLMPIRNPMRHAALEAGEAIYLDQLNPCWCGCETRYTKNACCTACLIAKGKARYAALRGDALLKRKAADHARYAALDGDALLKRKADDHARYAAKKEASGRPSEVIQHLDPANALMDNE